MGIFTLLVRGSLGDHRAWKGSKQDRRHARPTCRLMPGRLEPRRVLDAAAAGMFYSGADGLSDYVEVGSLGDSIPPLSSGMLSIGSHASETGEALPGGQAHDLILGANILGANQAPSNVRVLPTGPVLVPGAGLRPTTGLGVPRKRRPFSRLLRYWAVR